MRNRFGLAGTIQVWDLPPRRPWWINYGLPVLFVLLVLLGARHCVRFRKQLTHSANAVAAMPIDNVPATN